MLRIVFKHAGLGLTNSGDRLGVGHQAPGVRGEEASAMEDTWGKTNILLELLLDPSAPGAFLKDYLLVYLILSKGIGGYQISSARERPRLARFQSLGFVPSVTTEDRVQQGLSSPLQLPLSLIYLMSLSLIHLMSQPQHTICLCPSYHWSGLT